jgi:tRNA pseudouridine55 synthase
MNPRGGGILLVDKPCGPTSHDVVARVRYALAPGARGADRVRVGHAGTLDPLATGLLVVLVGKGTRLAPFLSGLDKTYTAEVRFGVATDTLDREGEVVATTPVPPTLAGLDAALASLTGAIDQVPPVYSALKRGGQPLYRLARRGLDVAAPAPRCVVVQSFVARDIAWGVVPAVEETDALPPAPDGRIYGLTLDVACGSGTYVRALARDLALALGTVGHLHALRRTSVGPFELAAAVPLGEFALSATPASYLIPLGAALPHLPAHTLTKDQVALLQRGGRLDPAWLPAPLTTAPLACLLDQEGRLVAVVRGGENLDLAAVFPVRED